MATFTPGVRQPFSRQTKPEFPSMIPLLSVLFIFGVLAVGGSLLLLYVKLKMMSFIGAQVDSLREHFSRGAITSTRFSSKGSPLTEVEQDLFRRLVKALPEHYILSQVAFSQFLSTSGADEKERFRVMATMKQKVADFIVCSQRFDIVAVIELDDSSHDAAKDAKRDGNLKEAGLKTIRWHVSRMPDAAKIRWDVLGLKDGPEGEPISRWAPRPD